MAKTASNPALTFSTIPATEAMKPVRPGRQIDADTVALADILGQAHTAGQTVRYTGLSGDEAWKVRSMGRAAAEYASLGLNVVTATADGIIGSEFKRADYSALTDVTVELTPRQKRAYACKDS